MLFNIINPSDPYTIEAGDLEVAAIAVSVLGHGQYALEEISGDRSGQVPFFMAGGHDEWFNKQFGRTFDASLTHVATTRRADLIKALVSVHLGTPTDKRAFDEMAAKCPDEESLINLLHEQHDAKRTSMNDIGRRAWMMAQNLASSAPVAGSA